MPTGGVGSGVEGDPSRDRRIIYRVDADLPAMLRLVIATALAPSRVASRPRSQLSLSLPIVWPEFFKKLELTEQPELTRVCRSLRSMKRERICEDPVVEAWYTTDGQSILLDDDICPDVLFIRSHHDKLFQKIRGNYRVILTGNPGISKSV